MSRSSLSQFKTHTNAHKHTRTLSISLSPSLSLLHQIPTHPVFFLSPYFSLFQYSSSLSFLSTSLPNYLSLFSFPSNLSLFLSSLLHPLSLFSIYLSLSLSPPFENSQYNTWWGIENVFFSRIQSIFLKVSSWMDLLANSKIKILLWRGKSRE